MGFTSWGGYYAHINQQDIIDNAALLKSTGLARLGYKYVIVDGGWEEIPRGSNGSYLTARDSSGNLLANPATFPNGMRWLGNHLHSLGLKFGIWTTLSRYTCGPEPSGSFGHFQQDAREFASWGVDYVKADWCATPSDQYYGKQYSGNARVGIARRAFSQFSQALRDTGRPIMLAASAPAYFFAGALVPPPSFWQILGSITHEAGLWRIGIDIQDNWSSVVRNFAQDTTVGLAAYARPGHWNDPDILEIGNGGLTLMEEQSQFTLWSELAAPLYISTNISKLSAQELQIVSNKDIIAVDQDPLGAQGTIVEAGSDFDVLAKPLLDGDKAVVLFNRAETAQTITTSLHTIGFRSGGLYRLEDLVSKDSFESTGTISATVPAEGTIIYRIGMISGNGSTGSA